MPWQDRVNLMKKMYHDKYNKEYDQKVLLKSETINPLDFKTPTQFAEKLKQAPYGTKEKSDSNKRTNKEENPENKT